MITDLPQNRFKRAIVAGQQQIGLWVSLASPYSAEIVAGSGFDWLVIDTEHSPNEVDTTLAQLQVCAAYPAMPVVRPAWNDTVLIKRHLDIGAQTLLVPYVQNAAEAERAVQAMRFPAGGEIRAGAGLCEARGRGAVPAGADRDARRARSPRGDRPHGRRGWRVHRARGPRRRAGPCRRHSPCGS